MVFSANLLCILQGSAFKPVPLGNLLQPHSQGDPLGLGQNSFSNGFPFRARSHS